MAEVWCSTEQGREASPKLGQFVKGVLKWIDKGQHPDEALHIVESYYTMDANQVDLVTAVNKLYI